MGRIKKRKISGGRREERRQAGGIATHGPSLWLVSGPGTNACEFCDISFHSEPLNKHFPSPAPHTFSLCSRSLSFTGAACLLPATMARVVVYGHIGDCSWGDKRRLPPCRVPHSSPAILGGSDHKAWKLSPLLGPSLQGKERKGQSTLRDLTHPAPAAQSGSPSGATFSVALLFIALQAHSFWPCQHSSLPLLLFSLIPRAFFGSSACWAGIPQAFV